MSIASVISDPGMILPKTSYVPFIAHRAPNAQVVWKNESLISSYALDQNDDLDKWLRDNYAFTTLKLDSNIDSENRKQFYAERYGGQLLAGNGGSGRAGINGKFQCKGIGPTPLVGANTVDSYSSGKASLVEMINEALWGEVCHVLLPHGAVRCLAVIDLGFSDSEGMRCGIAVRENEFRLAHFESSPYFRIKNNFQMVQEAKRTHSAIKSFTKCCESIYGSCNNIHDGLEKFVSRFAVQLAYAQFFRLSHGSLTSSNISLSAKYIDFGTMSSVGDYSNVITSLGNSGFLNEKYLVSESISNLVDNMNWFLPDEEKFLEAKYFIELFNNTLKKELVSLFTSDFNIKKSSIYLDGECVEVLFDKMFRFLTMGGLEEYHGVPYHNKGKSFFNLEELFFQLTSQNSKCSLIFEIYELIGTVTSLKGVCLNSYIDSLKKKYVNSMLNLDFLHYDVIRKDIHCALASNLNENKISNFIEEKVNRAISIRGMYDYQKL